MVNSKKFLDSGTLPTVPPMELAPSLATDSNIANLSNSVNRTQTERSHNNTRNAVSNLVSPNTPSSSGERLQLSRERTNALGLSVIWEPESDRSLDIVLVHGLGGTSHSTWSKDHDPKYFWPHLWLPREPVIRSARILTFGYNANWRSKGPKSILNITDFAKELLFAMKFSKNEAKNLEDLGIGETPIIFIAHSMGGLVVKKAYILGQFDDEYRDMVKSVSAIIFLSTPHRGSDLAKLLNRILSTSILQYSPKQYITDLQKNSLALEELNEQFRNFALKIQIVSLYETLQTVVGPKKVMILEKESAILGYPGEISRSMNADHHNVCKFHSPQDPNYIIVRDVLKTLVDRVRTTETGLKESYVDDPQPVKALLSIPNRPDDDYNFFRDRWMTGTCDWILGEYAFQNWSNRSSEPSILWLHGLPANGKSILSSFIINHLKKRGSLCHFYFFRFSEQSKRSINGLLRSLAFQASQDIVKFRDQLTELSEDGLGLEEADAQSIWTRIFLGLLLEQRDQTPLYWVIDALDEANTPQLLIDLLSGLRRSKSPVRILIVSRETHALSLGFNQLSNELPLHTLSITEQSREDIRLYVDTRMNFPRWDPILKQEISDKVIERADGNFLWIHLAIEDIVKRHTIDDIKQALEHLPKGMEAMYHRMASDIAKDTGPMDWRLGQHILAWAMYSRKSLTLRQLSEALKPQFKSIPDLRSTIQDICGFFVVVDVNDHVTMIHQTARDYLTKTPGMKFFVDTKTVHEDLFKNCMNYLMHPGIRNSLIQSSAELRYGFIYYAATSWSYHLSLMNRYSSSIISTLIKFLRGSSVLTWIHALASLRELKTLFFTSRALEELVDNKRLSKLDTDLDPNHHELLKSWSLELSKVAGKFGLTLIQDPTAIRRFVPDLCPRNSMLYQQFTKDTSVRLISVSGITNSDWDDSIAHVSLRNYHTSRIICSRRHFAAVATTGSMKGLTLVWNNLNFDKEATLLQDEYITASCFNLSGTLYVSCGVSKTKVWEIASGCQLFMVESPEDTVILGLTFGENDNTLLAASDDKRIRVLRLDSPNPQWKPLHFLKETDIGDLGYTNSPCAMEFNRSGTQIAVAYRGFPLSVWSVKERQLIGRCMRPFKGRNFNDAVWSGVDAVSWNNRYGSILGKYNDGCVFKWDPYEHESQELRIPVATVQCSPDGLSFATCDNHNVIRLFDYQTFSPIYHLRCHTTIKAFAYAPTSRGFYEVRDTTCTAWEPPALAELQETGDLFDDLYETRIATSFLVESGQVAEQADPMTALAVTANGKYFCIGNEAGEVILYNHDCKKIMGVWSSPRLLMIDSIIWDNEGRNLSFIELGGNVIVKHLKPPVAHHATKLWEICSTLDIKPDPSIGRIRQLLFNHDGSLLLLAGQLSAQTWALECRTVLGYCEDIEIGTSWINDPHNNEFLIAFDHHGIRRFGWKDLKAGRQLPYHKEPGAHSSSSTMRDHAFDKDHTRTNAKITQHRSHVIFREEDNRGFSQSWFINVSDLDAVPHPKSLEKNESASRAGIQLICPPDSVSGLVEMPLGVLSRNRLVFLDQDLWICTWKIDSSHTHSSNSSSTVESIPDQMSTLSVTDPVKRHFTLPRDWINGDNLSLVHMAKDGTLFCPKGGEVAVIRTRLSSGW